MSDERKTEPDDVERPDLDRLELCGLIAPYLRSATEETLRRKITIYNQESGKIVSEGTGVDLLRGLASLDEIRHAVQPGERPTKIVCAKCKRPEDVGPSGPVPKYCSKCKRCRRCGGLVSKSARSSAMNRGRGGMLCSGCYHTRGNKGGGVGLPNCIDCKARLTNHTAKRCKSCDVKFRAVSDPEKHSAMMKRAWGTRHKRTGGSALDRIILALESCPNGMSGEALREASGLTKGTFYDVTGNAIEAGLICKVGKTNNVKWFLGRKGRRRS